MREQQLEKMGFVRNDDQRSYCLSKYDYTWYVDFWALNCTEEEWDFMIEGIEEDVENVKPREKRNHTILLLTIGFFIIGILIGKFML